MVKILSGGFQYSGEKPEENIPYSAPKSVPNNADELLSQLPSQSTAEMLRKLGSPLGETNDVLSRLAGRTLARGAETVLGGAGDIAQAGLGIANYLSGGNVPSYGQVQENLPISLPTSEDVQKFHEPYTGEALKPQGRIEELGDEATKLITALAFPLGGVGALSSGSKIGKAIGKIPQAAKVAVPAVGAAEVARQLNLGEGPAEAIKLGVLLASGLPGGRAVLEKRAEDAYKTVNSIPESVKHRVPDVESTLKKARRYTELGHLTEPKVEVNKFAESVEKALEKGKIFATKNGRTSSQKAISVRELTELERNANALLRDSRIPREAKKAFISPFKEEFTKALDEYGQTNPTWNQAYQESKDIYRGLKARTKVNEFLQENVNLADLLKNKFTQAALFGGFLYNPYKLPYAAVAYAILAGAREAVKFGEFLMNSKNAQKYYWDATKAALDRNKNGFIQSAKRLDNLAQKYESEHPEEIEESPVSKGTRILSGGVNI